MFARLADRPWLVALLIGIAAQLLFAFHLDRPSRVMFDETHYVPAARTMLALERPTNTEHPLLGKALIAAGMAVFGDTPLGWRGMATLAGTATVLGVYALLLILLGGKVRAAAFGAALVALNQILFVQARIAMLDVFMGAFLVCGLASLFWAVRGAPRSFWWRWLLGAVLLGLAVGVKWAAAPYIALAALAFLIHGWFDPNEKFGRNLLALALLGAASIASYFLTFLPAFFYATDAMTLDALVPFQRAMYEAQTQILRPHPYQSDWWSWPLMIRPIWYFYEPDLGFVRGVLLIGNPVVMWGGLVATGWCWWLWFSRGSSAPFWAALLWTASVGVYVIIPKSLGFFYYYHLGSIFICLALAVAFDASERTRRWMPWFLGAAVVAFAYFYPIIAASPLANDQGFNDWMWFDSWR